MVQFTSRRSFIAKTCAVGCAGVLTTGGVSAQETQDFPANVRGRPVFTAELGDPLYSTEFEDYDDWVVETENEENPASIDDGDFVIATPQGTTVWLDQQFQGNVLFEYDVVVPSEGEAAEVTDLNNFWMSNAVPGERSGTFPDYHNLVQYYVGQGGHHNTKTRFQRYPRGEHRESGESLVGEYTDDAYLIEPDTKITVQAGFYEGNAFYGNNGRLFFMYDDPNPLKEGIFGFRNVHTRKRYQRFSAHRLDSLQYETPTATETPQPTDTPAASTPTERETAAATEASGPGFGVLSSLAAAGAGYLYYR